MSVWKKASKSHQKTHKERHQPEERQHLGLLEKKKDYVRRANDFNEKKQTLKLLHKRALNKNPDEFYHHMINSKVDPNGMHFDKASAEETDEDTPDQRRLMLSQDLKYVVAKRTQEKKKIDKLQAHMHLSSVDHRVRNKHVYFAKNIDREEVNRRRMERLSGVELPDVDLVDLAKCATKNRNMYGELAKRIKREKELAVVQEKIEMNRHLADKRNVLKPRRVRKGTATNAPVYVWKYERKR